MKNKKHLPFHAVTKKEIENRIKCRFKKECTMRQYSTQKPKQKNFDSGRAVGGGGA